MPYIYRIYYRQVQQLESDFAQIEKHGTHIEIDTDDIEEVLEDWQQLIAELYEEGDSESRYMAQEVEAQLENFELMLDAYVQARINYEEEDAINQASTRLTQSRTENYHHNLKQASENPETTFTKRISSQLEEHPQPEQRRSRLELPSYHRLSIEDTIS